MAHTEKVDCETPTEQEAKPHTNSASDTAGFPVVGIGASAGGLDAASHLLKALPTNTGMAFVLVQHLDPTHSSMLAEILSRSTHMPVLEVHDEPVVLPNHVYVIPPGQTMSIGENHLTLQARPPTREPHRPIDSFLRSLAQDQRHRAIGVILSGMGNDGTLGLQEIKAAGGVTFAQDQTAQYEVMPRSAMAAGCVDFVLPPDKIAEELVRIGRHPHVRPLPALPPQETTIAAILDLLHDTTGVDFTLYKSTTLYRRISRRMLLHRFEGLQEYLAHLREDPAEVKALYRDVLISVTSFFRDPEALETLKSTVLKELLTDRSQNNPLRVWVLGCSTGEEAYSIAMAIVECCAGQASQVPIQIFATDLNELGIEKVRSGLYSKNIAQDVSPERLRRYFVETDSGYQVTKSIREMCVFARHNVGRDPPFSRMDLISCRNLLIYMEPSLQRKVVPLVHYALKPNGYLWLGTSETVGSFGELFDVVDNKHRIYRKCSVSMSHERILPMAATVTQTPGIERPRADRLNRPRASMCSVRRTDWRWPNTRRRRCS